MLHPSLLITAVLAAIAIAARPYSEPDCEKTKTKTTRTLVKPQYGSTTIAANTYDAVSSEVMHSSVVRSSSISHSNLPSSGVGTAKMSHSSGVSSTAIAPSSGTGSFTTHGSSASSSVAASSSRASSSFPTLSSTAATASVISMSGCPLITPASTYTYKSTAFVYDQTQTTYYPPYTVTYITSYVTPAEYAATFTSYTSTFTTFVFETLPASSTVTVPTPSGFTPILCDSSYYRATSTEIVTQYLTTVVEATDTNATTTTLTDYSVVTLANVTTSRPLETLTTFLRSTATVTVTRASPTQTIYDACQTNNVTPKLPDGSNALFSYRTGNVTGARYLASDPADCCSLCQGNSSCVGSQWLRYVPGIFEVTLDRSCILFSNSSRLDTCDPTSIGPLAGSGSSDGPYSWLSNGVCGQWTFSS